MTKPDIVYVVRPGPNEELRYSLRSLSNLPHGKVWIFGAAPSWVTGVEVVPIKIRPGGHRSAKANLKAACQHPDVSETFIYFNDDFFVMQPMDSLPVMHRGTLAEVIDSKKMVNSYTRASRQTLELLKKQGIAEPLMYDLHAPLTVTKTGMLEALALCSTIMYQERTIYGNLNGVGGEKRRNYKAGRTHTSWKSWPFLSTNDTTFRALPIGQYIRSQHPTPSPYETDPPPAKAAREPRTPVRYHSVGHRVRAIPA